MDETAVTTPAPDAIDGVALEIMWARLISVADEAATALKRAAFSTIVRESNDFAVVILDEDGRSLAENTIGVPAFLGVMPRALAGLLEAIPVDDWHDGDVVVTNDPWIGTGHLPDLVVAAPIFVAGRRVGFSVTTAHLPDIGGTIFSAGGRDVFEEGLRIPPCKLVASGRENPDIVRIIRANVRLPDLVMQDIAAQISAHHIARSGVRDFLSAFRLAGLCGVSAALHGRSERAMRRVLASLPNGEYRAEVVADGDDERETRIVCSVRIVGDALTVDYGGSSPQAVRGINSVYNYTYAYTVYPLKCVLDPLTPANDGAYRPIRVIAPEGSILNPRFPAPCNARQLTGQLLAGALYACLAEVLPDRVVAESGSAPTLRALFGGTDALGRGFSQILMASGGMGASAQGDGLACTPFPTNTGPGSIEAFESQAPLVVRRKELRPDSGGEGRFRGGLGQTIEIEAVGPTPIRLSLMSDRIHHPPQGLLGAGSGAATAVCFADGRPLPPKAITMLAPGDRLVFAYAGGGGFGDPRERDTEARRRDIEDGLVSPASMPPVTTDDGEESHG